MEEIGLFDLTSMKVVKKPDYLFHDSGFRANLMKKIKKHFKELPGVVEDPLKRTLLEY